MYLNRTQLPMRNQIIHAIHFDLVRAFCFQYVSHYACVCLPRWINSISKLTNIICKCQIKPFIISAISSGSFFPLLLSISLHFDLFASSLKCVINFLSKCFCVGGAAYTKIRFHHTKGKICRYEFGIDIERTFISKTQIYDSNILVCMNFLITTVSVERIEWGTKI